MDLSNMSDIISILSGRIDLTIMAEEIIKEYGEDPAIWLQILFSKLNIK